MANAQIAKEAQQTVSLARIAQAENAIAIARGGKIDKEKTMKLRETVVEAQKKLVNVFTYDQ